jgi:hypothetical protein
MQAKGKLARIPRIEYRKQSFASPINLFYLRKKSMHYPEIEPTTFGVVVAGCVKPLNHLGRSMKISCWLFREIASSNFKILSFALTKKH